MDRTTGEIGYRFGLAACASAIAFDIVQILQVAGVLRFPIDEILIYGTSLCIVVPFILEMAALHHLTPPDKRFWTHSASVFTAIYAVFVVSNYVVQLATVIPAKLKGAAGGLALLDQTPHSLFWDYDAVGYISMGIAALLAVPAVGKVGFERGARRALLAHAAVTPLIGIVYFAPGFSVGMLFLGLPWMITAPLFMGMLAVTLRRRGGSPSIR